MTPLKFETGHAPMWIELEALLALAESKKAAACDAARLAALYRRVCEHLALAQARAYPIHLTQRLEALTQRAHRLIYRRNDYGLARFARLALVDFPEAVRAHRRYIWLAMALWLVPMALVGWAAWRDPEFVLHLLDVAQVREYESMYSDADKLGSTGARDADTDWQMFGTYIMRNTGLGFQCFAGGFFGGLGSAIFLVFNGLHMGAVGGYLIGAGHALNFTSFVVTHSAFELTAAVLSGAAGLRLGFSWLAPGRLTRLEALKLAAREAVVVLYGAVGLFFAAAAIEAFWSSAPWLRPGIKYGVGALCWTVMISYLVAQGRPRKTTALALTASQRGTDARR